MFHSTYYGVNIYKNVGGGYRMPWYTVEHGLAADTLDGLKFIIRKTMKG